MDKTNDAAKKATESKIKRTRKKMLQQKAQVKKGAAGKASPTRKPRRPRAVPPPAAQATVGEIVPIDNVTVQPEMQSLASKSFLEAVSFHHDYLLKIDPRVTEKAEAFKLAALYGACVGHVPLTVRGGKRKLIRGFTPLGKLFKADVYRGASLRPRPSDTDFVGQTLEDIR